MCVSYFVTAVLSSEAAAKVAPIEYGGWCNGIVNNDHG